VHPLRISRRLPFGLLDIRKVRVQPGLFAAHIHRELASRRAARSGYNLTRMSAPKAVGTHVRVIPATRSEKIDAFNKLDPDDCGKLLNYARYIAAKLSGRVWDADAEDLYQEALSRALDEENTRNWFPYKVDFVGFLRGCIRSIADDWYRKSSVGEPGDRQPRYTELPDGDQIASATNYQAQTEAAILIEQIYSLLRERPFAVEIFDLKLAGGLRARDIQVVLGIPKNVYDAAVKWIDRTLRRGGFRK
jgi:DNA-directed RNA polymerase specialized sigma24 family protein